jgi:hypothetical protein
MIKDLAPVGIRGSGLLKINDAYHRPSMNLTLEPFALRRTEYQQLNDNFTDHGGSLRIVPRGAQAPRG